MIFGLHQPRLPVNALRDVRGLARPALRVASTYDPGPSVAELEKRYGVPRLSKLNWNEDLFGPLPGVREAIRTEIERVSFYPEQAYSDFRRLVGEWAGTDASSVVPAHGIQALVLAAASVFLEPGSKVVLPAPTYGLYGQACAAAGAQVVTVPNRGYRLDLEAMAAAARQARLVLVCDPNNPTGDALSPAEWNSFKQAVPDDCVIVTDEAYADYMAPEDRPDRMADVRDGRPVVVLRTFSKLFGLAGLRLGYAVMHPDLAACFDAVQEPFNVNRLALAAGKACLVDPAAVRARRLSVVEAREQLEKALADLGIFCVPSQANFVLAETGGDDIAWYEALIRRGFLVRPGSEFGLSGHLRITVGPSELMTKLIAAMRGVRDELRLHSPAEGPASRRED